VSEHRPQTRWARLTGGVSGSDYAARFETLAAAGQDLNGEAAFCAALVPTPARLLDAGCGTGRVAVRLQELGYDCVGVDADESMLAVAVAAGKARSGPAWVLADLSTLDLDQHGIPGGFDVCVTAGNVIPLLAEGTLERAVGALTATLRPGGLLVSGFGLGPRSPAWQLPHHITCGIRQRVHDGRAGAAGAAWDLAGQRVLRRRRLCGERAPPGPELADREDSRP